MSTEIEVAVRRELASQGRRWAPLLVGALLVVTVLGTTTSTTSTPVATGPTGGGFDQSNGDFGDSSTEFDTTPGGPAATPGEGLDPTAPSGGSGFQPAPGGAPGAAPPTTGPGVGQTTVPGQPSPGGTPSGEPAAGVSRTGVTCDGVKRQLPESDYGPLCVPAFTGNNGGATSYGVTKDEIIVTYRIGDSASMSALQAAGGNELESVGLDQEGIAADMAVLVDYFNTRFELYGRKVKFTVYRGQGDIMEEYQGRSQQGAQADAARAKDLGAFADVSYAGQSQLYSEALVSNQIIAMSPIYLTRSWHRARAPYTHSPMWPAGEEGGAFQGNIVCGSLTGKKAARSNDPVMAQKDRVFGIMHPENPEYSAIGEAIEAKVKACGGSVGRRIAYSLDVTQAVQTATNSMAQMQSAGVTTVLCSCDFLGPAFLMQAADQQGYVPEWFMTFHWSDAFYRTYPTSQFRGQLVAGGVTEPYLQTEPGKIFREGSGGADPESPFTFDKVYQQIHMLFTGIQSAGPNLNPATMFQGLERVPDTASGAVGPWDFGPGPSIPRTFFALGAYDPEAKSQLDGETGSSIACRGGRYIRFDDVAGLAGPLDCPL